MVRVAVLSDIHGNRWALEAVVADALGRGAQHLLNLGDLLYDWESAARMAEENGRADWAYSLRTGLALKS
jgi:predicted phosphodiesterase